jgi:hypothetical protein
MEIKSEGVKATENAIDFQSNLFESEKSLLAEISSHC